MQKAILLLIVALIVSGCKSTKLMIYNNEIKYATKIINEELPHLVKKGKITQYQSDKIKPGIQFIIDRAERKIEGLNNDRSK